MTLSRLILLRHGQTEHNATNRMQGQTDTVLSAVGRAQAAEIAPVIAAMKPDVVISSDLARAADTAAAVVALTGHELRTDARLRETHLGRWQDRTHIEVDRDYPGARIHWRGDARWAPPGGESRVEVGARARAVVEELATAHTGGEPVTALLVAHGGLIAALTASLLDLPVDHWPVIGRIGNTCWAELERGRDTEVPPWRLERWNVCRQEPSDVE